MLPRGLRLIHHLGPELHEPQSVLKRHDAGSAKRGVVPHSPARRDSSARHDSGLLGLEFLKCHQRGDKKQRLAELCAREKVLRAQYAELQHVVAEDGPGLAEHLLDDRQTTTLWPQHANMLAALARKQERYGRLKAGPIRQGTRCGALGHKVFARDCRGDPARRRAGARQQVVSQASAFELQLLDVAASGEPLGQHRRLEALGFLHADAANVGAPHDDPHRLAQLGGCDSGCRRGLGRWRGLVVGGRRRCNPALADI
mmetsp:Transcript_69828/g.185589  ORF Transcript_69828/g.185589 Transcript_69828/m.185589 type:complete len:257 (+) Transcript_69828:516-1286(+)